MATVDLTNTTFYSSDDYEWTDIFVQVVNRLCIYYGLFLIVVACICNSISFIILSRKSFRSTNMSLHLRVLSLSDLGAVLIGLLNFFMVKAYGVDLRSNQVACQASVYLAHDFLFISSWILVIMTVERVMAIYWPHRIRTLCSELVAKVILATTIVILCFVSLLPTLTYGIVIESVTNASTVLKCQVAGQDAALNLGLSFLYIILFAFLPSVLLVVLNIILVAGVVRSREMVTKKSSFVDGSNDIKSIKSKQGKKFQQPKQNRVFRREASLTKTVLAVNITFIVCNFPTCANSFSPRYMTKDGIMNMSPAEAALQDLLLLLMYTNNAMNFVMYCATGSKFRSEVKAFISVRWC